MLGFNCIITAAEDDGTKSSWLTVFIHGELYFREEDTETFSWSLILIAFLWGFNEQTQTFSFCKCVQRATKKAKREIDILMLGPCSVCSVWTSISDYVDWFCYFRQRFPSSPKDPQTLHPSHDTFVTAHYRPYFNARVGLLTIPAVKFGNLIFPKCNFYKNVMW